MDPITARRILRIFPETPLSTELIVQAHAGEVAARHPSLYPDGADRARAEEWVRTLDSARDVLLAQVPAAPGDVAAVVNAPRKRRLSTGAIVGIVAGGIGLVVVIGLVILGAFSIVQGVGEITETLESELAADPSADDGSDAASGGSDGTELADVERYTADETFFTFPAAMELYNDGRYGAECPVDYAEGCWQAAIVTESDCDALQLELGFANDPDAFTPEHVETLDLSGIAAGVTTPVVFGQDEYDIGWINDVRCLDAAG